MKDWQFRMRLRDLLAVPFVLTGMFLIYVGILVGGSWTAGDVVKMSSDIHRKSRK